MPVLIVAAVVGDAVNYSVGRRARARFLDDAPDTGWIHQGRQARARAARARVLRKARRQGRRPRAVRADRAHFVPFVAGGAGMTYRTFALYNVTGAILWVGICVGAGYLFGNIPVVKENFELVVLGIVACRCCRSLFEMIKSRTASKSKASEGDRHERTDRRIDGKGMKLHTKILLGLAVGLMLGHRRSISRSARAIRPSRRINDYVAVPIGRSSCACCSWW